jgi:hypothetical protein
MIGGMVGIIHQELRRYAMGLPDKIVSINADFE